LSYETYIGGLPSDYLLGSTSERGHVVSPRKPQILKAITTTMSIIFTDWTMPDELKEDKS
jgi:hypothetical protein